MPIKTILCLVTSVLICSFSHAQNEQASEINVIASGVLKNLPVSAQNIIFLQTDRNIYAAGDVIWFKAWLVDSVTGRITYKTKSLFVDLVDDKDTVITQLLLAASKSMTDGVINLSTNLKEGYYWLRSYTKDMATNNPGNITVIPLYIITRENDELPAGISKKSPQASGQPVVNFYPEGGSLISGTNSVVAVKAMDDKNNPLALSGYIKNEHDTIVSRFSTNVKGIGKFNLAPSWYGKYNAYIQYDNKEQFVGKLPSVNLFAGQIALTENTAGNIKVRIMLEDSIYRKDYTTYILGFSKDSLCFASVGKGIYEVNIPSSGLPGGIAHFLLFGEGKQFLSERDVYIRKDNAGLDIKTDKPKYVGRENVQMDISVTDANARPIVASLSISVTDARMNDTMMNSFHKDELYNYSSEDADLYMLAQNSWYKENIGLKEKQNPALKTSTDDILKLEGRVEKNKKEPVPDEVVTLLNNTEGLLFMTDTTDAEGRFRFLFPEGFTDSSKFSLQTSSLSGKKDEYEIITDPPDMPHFTTPSFLKQRFSEDEIKLAKRIKTSNIDSLTAGAVQWLTPVTVKAKNLSTRIKYTIITRQEMEKGHLNDLAEVVVRSGKFSINQGFLIAEGPNQFGVSAGDEPIIMLNGGQQSAGGNDPGEGSPVLSYLRSIPVKSVDHIEIITGAEGAGYGLRGGHGVIEIYSTSKLTDIGGTGLKTVSTKGYHVSKPFNMPDYKEKKNRNSKDPDLRRTIYWNGDIITDQNGKVSINFFTADSPATYVVTISGITANGNIIYKTITLNRK